MKRITTIITLLLFTTSIVFAQSNKEEIELYQSIFGMEKKAAVEEFVTLDGDAGKRFWELYDKYEEARKLHGQKRLALLEKYVDNYLELDDESTKALMKEMISLGDEYNKLIKKYHKSIGKACGAKAAGQFYQLETYFQSAIRMTLMEEIPFIGELDD